MPRDGDTCATPLAGDSLVPLPQQGRLRRLFVASIVGALAARLRSTKLLPPRRGRASDGGGGGGGDGWRGLWWEQGRGW